MDTVTIRKFSPADRDDVRRISCRTAFWGDDNQGIFDDDEILADALTKYFTDYEPQSSFVAVNQEQKVIGYIIGSTDVRIVSKIMTWKIVPQCLVKAVKKGVFFQRKNWQLAGSGLISFLKGEFFMSRDFSRGYPATLHINIDKGYRGAQLGMRLMETFLDYLRENNITGVHLGTFTEQGKRFFTRMNFHVLFKARRTYLQWCLKKDMFIYIFGRIL